MRRILPPLAILAILAFVAVRALSDPAREEMREQIDALVHDASQQKRVLARLESYQASFDNDDDRWYAARVYLQLRRPGRALDAIWPQRAGAMTSADTRRFGELALTTLGWTDASRGKPSPAGHRALVALTERPHPWADARLREIARTPDMTAVPYFFHAIRQANERPVRIMVEEFRSRSAAQFKAMAAHTAMQAAPYPEREQDLAVLYEVLQSKRREERPNWAAAAVALGRSEDPRGRELLDEYEKRLERSTSNQDRIDLALLYTARIAAGDWSRAAAVKARVFGDDFDPFVVAWYLEAVLDRYRADDPESPAALKEMFINRKSTELRARIVMKLLLSEEPMPLDTEEKVEAVGEILAWLKLEGDPLGVAQVLAYELREKRPDALANLLQFLRQLEVLLQDSRRLSEVAPAYMAGLRAMYLYG